MRWRVGAALFLVTLATRLPFATDHLWAHDSVLYARALEHFDPAAHQPQPPGYLYYVALLRVVALVVGDANRAMTLVSAVAAAAAVALLYAFVARLYEERTARGAALLLLTSVTFWGYGAVAYPYTLLAALTIASAWLFWRALERGRRGVSALPVASAAWGLAIGFRPDLAVFGAPLWASAAVAARPPVALASAGIVAGLVALWLGASALAADGLAAFVDATRLQAQAINDQHSVLRNGLAALATNAYEIGRALTAALFGTLLLLPVLLWRMTRGTRDVRRTAYVALWTAAPLPVYLLVHIGDFGYVFSLLPGLCVLASRAAVRAADAIQRPRAVAVALGAAALCNAVVFLYADVPASATDLARRDQGIAEKMRYLDRLADAYDLLVVTGHDRAVVGHYAGGRYAVVGYAPNGKSRAIGEIRCGTRCARRTAVVVWDDGTRVIGGGWHVARMKHGARLRVGRVDEPRELRLRNGVAIELVAAP